MEYVRESVVIENISLQSHPAVLRGLRIKQGYAIEYLSPSSWKYC